MKFAKRVIPVIVMLAVSAGAAVGQVGQQGAPQSVPPADTVSDDELQIVVSVIDSAQVIQQQIAMQVETIVEDEGMEFTRFEEIMTSRQNPQASPGVETTEEEDQIIQQIQPQLGTVQQQAQQQFAQVLQSEGLDPMRFQQIMQAVQTDPEINQRFQEMMGSGS